MPPLMAPSTEKPTQTPAQGDPCRFTAIVSGDVQGVGYRAFARRYATELGIGGHAENLADGRVEIVAEGRYGDLMVLLKHLRVGPAHAVVKRVDVEWSATPPSLAGAPEFRTY